MNAPLSTSEFIRHLIRVWNMEKLAEELEKSGKIRKIPPSNTKCSL